MCGEEGPGPQLHLKHLDKHCIFEKKAKGGGGLNIRKENTCLIHSGEEGSSVEFNKNSLVSVSFIIQLQQKFLCVKFRKVSAAKKGGGTTLPWCYMPVMYTHGVLLRILTSTNRCEKTWMRHIMVWSPALPFTQRLRSQADGLNELVHWRRSMGRGSNEILTFVLYQLIKIYIYLYFGSNVLEGIYQINIHIWRIIV